MKGKNLFNNFQITFFESLVVVTEIIKENIDKIDLNEKCFFRKKYISELIHTEDSVHSK